MFWRCALRAWSAVVGLILAAAIVTPLPAQSVRSRDTGTVVAGVVTSGISGALAGLAAGDLLCPQSGCVLRSAIGGATVGAAVVAPALWHADQSRLHGMARGALAGLVGGMIVSQFIDRGRPEPNRAWNAIEGGLLGIAVGGIAGAVFWAGADEDASPEPERVRLTVVKFQTR